MNSRHHNNDAFQVVIQLFVVTTREIYIRLEAVCAKGLNVKRYHIKCLTVLS